MTFWTDSNFEPKRAFRWKVNVLSGPSAGTNIASFLAKKVTKPQLTIEEAEHKHLNKSYYFPGHVKWDPVTVTLIDTNGGDVVSSITEAFKASNYDFVSGKDTNNSGGQQGQTGASMATLKKGTLVGASSAGNKTVSIEQLDADGNIVETMTLHNAWIKSFKPSELSYDTEDLSSYDVELRFDWASYTKTGEENA